ncbi:MAG: TraR/DksA family transcriptional regulator [Alphaproteobacteria bacterium]|jgi:DnaK suppressor protein|nr:TraR/DksA family transcriptional regulator [Alphaproteobacteria bacterium]
MSDNNYKPTEQEEFMNEQMVKYFENKLLEMKDKVLSRDKDHDINEDLQDLKEADPNDRATKEEEAALDLKNKERINKTLADIEVALNKIKTGDYGYCEETEEEIAVMRLEAMPTTRYSIEALKELEKNNGNRPI